MDEFSRYCGSPLSGPGDHSIHEGLSGESNPSAARSGGFRQVRACRHRGMPWSGGYCSDFPERFGRTGRGKRQANSAFRQGGNPRPAARMDRP